MVGLMAAAVLLSGATLSLVAPTSAGADEPPVAVPPMDAGAAPIGTATYVPPPTGAYYASPTGSDSGLATVLDPSSLQRALSLAPSGSTIVLRAGIYRQTVYTPPAKRLTIQPFPGEAVWFSGSEPVTGWVRDGGGWRKDGWTQQFENPVPTTSLIDPAYPMALHQDMVFANGLPLAQVGARNQLRSGAFFVDYATAKLYIGADPVGIEASVRQEAIILNGTGSIVRGLGFMNYANNVNRPGVLRAMGPSQVLQNNHVLYSAASGISVRSTDVQVLNNTTKANGQTGIHAYQTNRVLVEKNLTEGNNIEHFNSEAEAGGLKATYSPNMTLRGNIAKNNDGHGLWIDAFSDNAAVVSNYAMGNTSAGIFFEFSKFGILASNTVFDNLVGMLVSESDEVNVWNNTFWNNGQTLGIWDGVRDPIVNRVTVRNNIISAGPGSTEPLIIQRDANAERSYMDMGIVSNHNYFFRPSTATTPFICSLSNFPAATLWLRTLDEVRTSSNQEGDSVGVDDSPVDPYLVLSDGVPVRTANPVLADIEEVPARVVEALGAVPVTAGAL
jgi:parallel beta-helix repeat protein